LRSLFGFLPVFAVIFFSGAFACAEYAPDAVVTRLYDESRILAHSHRDDWNVGEVLAVVSQNSKLGTIAFVEVLSVQPLPPATGSDRGDDGADSGAAAESLGVAPDVATAGASADGPEFEIKLSLLRQSRRYFVQPGDFLRRLDLSTANEDYVGTTELIIKDRQNNISSKYRPLVYQGFVIGDTAQTLSEKEFLVNYFGNVYYGFRDWLTVGTLAPVNVLGRPNFNFRAKLYDSETTTISSGLSFVRLVKENQASVNLNFYWDSTSSGSMISHTYIGVGLATLNNAGDAAAIKYLTSNSFQTGYEVVLNNWDRFLIGPSYNFEKKALGGYLSYIWIMDRFHLQLSINATDITHMRLDPTDGYYGFFDIFWRF
jgi:hypothetical protein